MKRVQRKYIIEITVAGFVLVLLLVFTIPTFFNAQQVRQVYLRQQQLDTLISDSKQKVIEFINTTILSQADTQEPLKFAREISPKIQELGGLLNVTFDTSTVGGPSMTDSFIASPSGYEVIGIQIVTTVRQKPDEIIWVVAAPVPGLEVDWPAIKQQIEDNQTMKRFIDNQGSMTGDYGIETYRAYYKQYQFEVSNGLNSKGCILSMDSYLPLQHQ